MAALEKIIGSWSGDSQLFLEGDLYTCKSTANISEGIRSQFIFVSYLWDFEGTPQEGTIIFNSQVSQVPTKADWLDSWHMRNDIMTCMGTMDEKGVVALHGSYSVPSSPDWEWRIELEVIDDTLELRMFNIPPQGKEEPAVKALSDRVVE